MLKKWFGKKEINRTITVKAPLTGKLVALEDVPDPVFSEKMMGDGIAIEPFDNQVVSPVDGEIIQVFPTKHAVGIKAENGLEILIHVGLETVSMNGEGFESHVQEGSKVKTGDPLLTVNFDLVREKAKSAVTPIILTNADQIATMKKLENNEVQKGVTDVIEVTVK
ncbi:PTS sugar transporter subunit IIA [Bacillus litorisediminis]|uniref:PTS sugar transporter subunit IIA n=1 Tax=Bacillus litorisediminis TaxID=2922713 RepID=UPI001FADE0DF|nr:PTS glucose transporter subunit IIA [Bacillus litorisediminis]